MSGEHRQRYAPFMRGFTMVEFMVAIVLGLLVTDALVAMFVGVRSAGRMSSGVAALSDSGRFALDTIEENVRGAGNFACNSTAPVSVAGTPVVREISLLGGGGSPAISDYTEPLQGYEAVGSGPGATIDILNTPANDDGNTGDWVTTPALGGALDAALGTPPTPVGQGGSVGGLVKDSDILVIRESLASTPPAYTTVVAIGAGAFSINNATTFSGPNQIGAITNCVQTEIFQEGSFTPGGGGGTIGLGGVNPGNSAPGTLSQNIDFTIGSQVVPADTVVFYIGIGEDGDSALFRWETNGGVIGDATYGVNEELVPDVESMQILYGVETALSQTTQTVAQYVTADKVASTSITGDFNGVISVKVALLVASPPGTVQQGTVAAASPPTLLGTNWGLAAADGRMRKVYEQTMFLRNMSP